jgi:hypothetical protein
VFPDLNEQVYKTKVEPRRKVRCKHQEVIVPVVVAMVIFKFSHQLFNELYIFRVLLLFLRCTTLNIWVVFFQVKKMK